MTAQPSDAFPEGVPLVVPSSWKRATLSAPVPVVRCTYIFPDTHERPGEQCKRWSLRGAQKCVKHGAQLTNVKEHAAAVVEAGRLRLIEAVPELTDWLVDLAENSTSDAVRLKAITEGLDRAGLKGGAEIDINVNENQDPGSILRERLATLKRRTIDGEVVPDGPLEGDTVSEYTQPADESDEPHEEHS